MTASRLHLLDALTASDIDVRYQSGLIARFDKLLHEYVSTIPGPALKGLQLKKLREALKMTQKDVGWFSGVEARTVRRWESGASDVPLVVLIALKAFVVLGDSVFDLLKATGPLHLVSLQDEAPSPAVEPDATDSAADLDSPITEAERHASDRPDVVTNDDIRWLLTVKEMTPKQIADCAGVHVSSVHRWKDKTSRVTKGTAQLAGLLKRLRDAESSGAGRTRRRQPALGR